MSLFRHSWLCDLTQRAVTTRSIRCIPGVAASRIIVFLHPALRRTESSSRKTRATSANWLGWRRLLEAAIAYLEARGNPMDIMLNHVLEVESVDTMMLAPL